MARRRKFMPRFGTSVNSLLINMTPAILRNFTVHRSRPSALNVRGGLVFLHDTGSESGALGIFFIPRCIGQSDTRL